MKFIDDTAWTLTEVDNCVCAVGSDGKFKINEKRQKRGPWLVSLALLFITVGAIGLGAEALLEFWYAYLVGIAYVAVYVFVVISRLKKQHTPGCAIRYANLKL